YLHGELNTSGASRVSPFPAWETDPYAGLTPHADIQQARATTLWRLRNKQVDIVVASIRSMATRLPAPSVFDAYSLHLTSGEDLSQELLIEHLASAGYLRQEPVGAPGEFSVPGRVGGGVGLGGDCGCVFAADAQSSAYRVFRRQRGFDPRV